MTAFDETPLPTGAELEARLKAAAVAAGEHVETEPTLEDKVNYIFGTMKLLEEAVLPLLSQVGPIMEQAGPLLASFAPLASKANSPMGRIFGSLL
jgi:hypothetical protein